MSQITVTRNNEQSVTVEMPGTDGTAAVYSVFYPDPARTADAWVKVCRDGKWAQLNPVHHQRQIRNVVAAIERASA